jgi:mRNA interferase MazF
LATKSGSASYIPERGDLVWIDFDPVAGHEQAGRRPALVLSARSYNEIAKLAVMCPVTRHVKGYTFEVALPPGGIVSGVILADQLRCLSWPSRSVVFITPAPSVVVATVMERIEALLRLPPT